MLLPLSVMATSLAVVPPLVEFLELTYRRSLAAVVRCVPAPAASSSHSAWLHSAVDASRHSALIAPLSWSWFRREWLSSGCRLLPLLAAHMQSAVVQASNSACAPLNTATLAALHRTESWPRAALAAYITDCYDTLTVSLSQAQSSLARRVHVYYSLYCLHGCQVTVERYPVPLSRHHWQLLLDDVSALQQLPLQQPYAVLRDMLERQSASHRRTHFHHCCTSLPSAWLSYSGYR